MRFAIFRLQLSKLLRLPRKSEDLMLQMQPFSGNQRLDLLTALMNMSLVLHLPRKMHLCRSSSNVPRLLSLLEMPQNPHVSLTFDKVHNPARLPRKTTSEHPKVLRTPQPFSLLTSKCASRHNGVHFFDISVSKSGPKLKCFVHFDFEMCSGREVLLPFSMANVLRATTACTFSTWQLQKVFRTWCVFTFFAGKCALRHSCVHFFDISTSKSGPSMVCFVHFDLEMCFGPQRRTLFHLSSGQMAPHPPL